ncbi:hypothetical protein QUF80_05235 [Desulfococcaceae bacterium HSG8]|nr:hypothetical protein [Desulfococcaceae bacterium HSG8]
MIYFWKEDEHAVYLMAIYFKGTKETMTVKEVEKLLRDISQDRE